MRGEIIVLLCVLAMAIVGYVVYSCCVAAGRADDASERYREKQEQRKPDQPRRKGSCETCIHGWLGDHPEKYCPTCENRSNYEE